MAPYEKRTVDAFFTLESADQDQQWPLLVLVSAGSIFYWIVFILIVLTLTVVSSLVCACCGHKNDEPKKGRVASPMAHSHTHDVKLVQQQKTSISKPDNIGSPPSSAANLETVCLNFALNWLKALEETIQNPSTSTTTINNSLVVSPYACQTAFALCYLGCSRPLEGLLAQACFPGSNARRDDIVQLLRIMVESTKACRRRMLQVANRLYAPKGFSYTPNYRRQVSALFGGQQFLEVNYEKVTDSFIDSVNRWVAAATSNRAPNLIHDWQLSATEAADIRLVMVSAASINATNHRTPFDRYYTIAGTPFHVDSSDRTVPVDMMCQTNKFGYFEDDRCQVVRFIYENQMSMYIFLPKQRNNLTQFTSALTAKYLTACLKSCAGVTENLEIFIPKFRIDTEISRNQLPVMLSKLDGSAGNSATIENALFQKPAIDANSTSFVRLLKEKKSPTSKDRSLWLSYAIQRAVLEFADARLESEASLKSVTADIRSMTGSVSSASENSSHTSKMVPKKAPQPVKLFKADHPFLFMLAIDQPIIVPLMIGRYCGQ